MNNNNFKLNTSVLFLVFNRLGTTKKVFEAIKKAQPPKLYLAADGPRNEKLGEYEMVQAVRDYLSNSIDWDCEVKTLFREKNLGCKHAVSDAINWFFDHEEMGIILEDDCLPSQSFFWFCENLLKKYKDDKRIGMVSGFNYGIEDWKFRYDYVFSKYPMIWGWATWKTRWKNYLEAYVDYDEIVATKQLTEMFGKNEASRRMKQFENARSGIIDTWDYVWALSLYKNCQFTIIPKFNLIENVGFGLDATHTTGVSKFAKIKTSEISLPLIHPPYIVQDPDIYKIVFNKTSLLKRVCYKVRKKIFSYEK
ncbi:hypothetical protein CHISP_1552 [Chitinispirillum alkaliphilum]|nr:hypothetical protein CHISP_1552 [Chitinispirillum alkaliphilum]